MEGFVWGGGGEQATTIGVGDWLDEQRTLGRHSRSVLASIIAVQTDGKLMNINRLTIGCCCFVFGRLKSVDFLVKRRRAFTRLAATPPHPKWPLISASLRLLLLLLLRFYLGRRRKREKSSRRKKKKKKEKRYTPVGYIGERR